MKAIEHYFSVVLFIMLYKVILSFESVDEILKCDRSMKAIEQYFLVDLFIMAHKMVHYFGPYWKHISQVLYVRLKTVRKMRSFCNYILFFLRLKILNVS